MSISPICLFTYNRPSHTKRTLDALIENTLASKSDLHIFSDGPKNTLSDKKLVAEVREIISDIKGFRHVQCHFTQNNKGLAESVIEGVTEVINSYGKVIVVEDDLVTSESFLHYSNTMLNKYARKSRVFSISGYNHPSTLMPIPASYKYNTYFCGRAASWGWATWSDRWKRVDWTMKNFKEFSNSPALKKKFNEYGEDRSIMLHRQMSGLIDSWAIRWDYSHFLHNALCLYPVVSFVDNIGNDLSGTHSSKTEKYHNDHLNHSQKYTLPRDIDIDPLMMESFRNVYSVSKMDKVAFKLLYKSGLYSVMHRIKKRKL